eukprot:2490465-Rhodomonas_salina.1
MFSRRRAQSPSLVAHVSLLRGAVLTTRVAVFVCAQVLTPPVLLCRCRRSCRSCTTCSPAP